MTGDAVRTLLSKKITNVIMAKIIIAVPFLGLPIIRQITSHFVSKVIDKVFVFAQELGIVIGAEYKIEKQQKKYDDAVVVLKDVIENPDATEEEKQKAENEFDKALADLINLKPN